MPAARAVTQNIYAPMSGARLSKTEAAIYGERLAYLARRTGELTPEVILTDAKNIRSPLHRYFEWDDKRAAVEYRITQARYLLRAIAIKIVGPSGVLIETRAFHNVAIPMFEDGEAYSVRVYKTSKQVFEDLDLKNQLVDQARAALEGWQDRYGRYSELDSANFLVRRAIRELRGSRRRGPKRKK